MSLTDTAIKKAKPGDKPVKLSDGKGLYLLVNPVGSKLWRWKYRFLGKEKVMSLGAYPDVSLAQARDGMGAARKLLASGTDPMAQRASDKMTKQASAENSFQSVALLWWDHWHGAKSARHADDVMRRLKADVFPAIGARPVSEIQAHELVQSTDTVTATPPDAAALAVAYQLVTDQTNFLLVHERADGEKAIDMPELQKIQQMVPAGWGGTGLVRFSRSSAVLAGRVGGSARPADKPRW